MNILVAGGCGFIGSHVVDALLRAGHGVRAFDRQAERFRAPLARVDYRFGEFTDRMALAEAIAGVDVVFHFVSTTFPGIADLDPQTDVRDNLVGTLQLIETMLSLGVSRLLFLSSGGTVYGIPERDPIPETHSLRPVSSYGIVKAAIEHYLEAYRRSRGLSPVIIRAANPYGPRQGHTGVQGVVSTFLRRIAAGEAIEIWGDGTVVRDYLDVADLAELCVLAGASRQEGPYNAGSGVGTSVNEIVEAIRTVTGAQVETLYKPGRSVDVPRSVLDCTRARTDFGWSARRPLAEGIRNTWDWLRAYRG